MEPERTILALARDENPLSLATAFDELDIPVPTVFLTCRSLTETGDLQRVGPGEYQITTQGRDWLTADGFDWQTETEADSQTDGDTEADADTETDADTEDHDPAILAAFEGDTVSPE